MEDKEGTIVIIRKSKHYINSRHDTVDMTIHAVKILFG